MALWITFQSSNLLQGVLLASELSLVVTCECLPMVGRNLVKVAEKLVEHPIRVNPIRAMSN